MKTTIFYFSATGNSLKLARDIAASLGETELIGIPKALKHNPDLSADRIGFVFPVHIWGLPVVVEEFARKLKIPPGKYIFAISDGAGFQGYTLLQLRDRLKENGAELSAGFYLSMPDNYIPWFDLQPEEKQRELMVKGKNKLIQALEIIRQNKEQRIERDSWLTNLIFSGLIYRISIPQVAKMDQDFWVDEKCNGCAVCEKVCPADNIKMAENKPVWQHRCTHCLACLHWCPEKALQFGKKTTARGRYQHPEIKLKDILAQK